jgi:hypothetical protein
MDIIGFSHQLSDDGKFAIVEFVARVAPRLRQSSTTQEEDQERAVSYALEQNGLVDGLADWQLKDGKITIAHRMSANVLGS